MPSRRYTVLFLCTGNSARSILAEALLNRADGDRFEGLSAGSYPKGRVHPTALALLEERGLPVDGLRSKSWDEFAGQGAPDVDFIVTVCDNAAGEVCPVWPGRPIAAHWGIEDPAAVEGPGQRVAFERAFRELADRIAAFIDLPIESFDRSELQNRLRQIGEQADTDG